MKKWTRGIVEACSEGENQGELSLLGSLGRNLTVLFNVCPALTNHMVTKGLLLLEPAEEI